MTAESGSKTRDSKAEQARATRERIVEAANRDWLLQVLSDPDGRAAAPLFITNAGAIQRGSDTPQGRPGGALRLAAGFCAGRREPEAAGAARRACSGAPSTSPRSPSSRE